jgi:hypothetical protein
VVKITPAEAFVDLMCSSEAGDDSYYDSTAAAGGELKILTPKARHSSSGSGGGPKTDDKGGVKRGVQNTADAATAKRAKAEEELKAAKREETVMLKPHTARFRALFSFPHASAHCLCRRRPKLATTSTQTPNYGG